MSHADDHRDHLGPHPAIVARQALPMVGLYALLTAEQKVAALNVTENESFGPPDWHYPGPRYIGADWPEAEGNG